MAIWKTTLQGRAWLGLLAAAIVAFGSMFVTADSDAASLSDTELVMMEEEGCGWCERWREEVGVVYDRTPEGQVAPLRLVDVHEPLPKDLQFLKPAYFTPTFILVSEGREIGRIQGYPGEDFFWALLGQLLTKLTSQALKAKIEQ